MSRPPLFPSRHPSDATREFSWSDRYPYGFGRTPTERLKNDMARLLTVHGLDLEHEMDALPLAEFVVAALELRRLTTKG